MPMSQSLEEKVSDNLKTNAQSPAATAGSPSPNDDDNSDDDYENDNYEYKERIGKCNGNTPRNNQAQNKQVDHISKRYGLTKDEKAQLHNEITKQGYGYSEIE